MNDLVFSNEYYCDEVRDGFYVPEMMKRYWAAQLEVLREIDRICKHHGLKWFANYGTLLGAVRHKGYIPWDDDLDITMLRDDYDSFFEAAREELPEGFVILTTNDQNEWAYPFGRVTNSHAIDINADFLKKFHGCPYVVGVDIYPYDKLYLSTEKEDDRDRVGKEVFEALKMVNNPAFDKSNLLLQLRKIEERSHKTFNRSGNIGNQLMGMMEELSSSSRKEDSADFTLVYSWILWKGYKFSKKYFEHFTDMPFESALIPVPDKYDEMLRAFYGDYMKMVRPGGLHEYPVFREQEKMYRDEKGVNPLRYTMTSDKVSKERLFLRTQEQCDKILTLLNSMHKNLGVLFRNGSDSDITAVLQACQNSAVSLGTLLESRYGTPAKETVTILEAYCEDVYNLSLDMTAEKIKAMDGRINRIRLSLAHLWDNRRKNILFLPCKAAWWGTMKPVFEAALADERNAVNIIPIPHFYVDFLGNSSEAHINATDFINIPEISDHLTNFEDYGLEKKHPDVIVIQVPYDGYSNAFSVPEILYSENLLRYTDELVYVPCFDTLIPDSDDDKIIAALEFFIEQPALVYADRIILKHERIKEIYLNTLVSLTSESLRDYWDKKISLLPDVPWCNA